MAETHYRACNLCEAICGIAIEHEDGKVLSIRGDADDPFSQGHICPKAVALRDVHEDPDRVRRPLRRRGKDFEEIGWDEALDEAAARLNAIRRQHGRDAVALYQGNPLVHNYGAMLWGGILFPMILGTKQRYSSNSIDALPRLFASWLLYGHQAVIPVPDVDRTSMMVLLGANPLASNGSVMSAPGIETRLRKLRERGGKVIVVDPRRTETAKAASEHLFVKPGRDALLLLALIDVLFEEKLAKPGRLAALVEGEAALAALARRFAPERVASACGIPADRIRRLARELVAAESSVVYGRVGVSIQEFGGLANFLIDVVNLLTGNLDRPGGAMFGTPAVDLVKLASLAGETGHFATFRSRVRGLPEFAGELPVAALSEEIETPGPGQVRGLVTAFGNPVLSTPNGNRLDRALASLEYMVSIDIYVNETTRHAHLILPTTASLEHDHYDVVLHSLGVRNTAKWSPPLFDPPPGLKHDWQVYLGLASRLVGEGLLGGAKRALVEKWGGLLTPKRAVDLLMRFGPHGLSIAKLERAVHGLDLGPLEPRLPSLLFTPHKRLQLAPELIAKDVERLERRLQEDRDELLLIGRRDLRTNNSWMHNSERLVKGKPRCTVMVHPDDARTRGLESGAVARVTSRVGAIDLPVEVTDDVMKGVVSVPHGWGHARDGVRLQVARAHAGVSVNDVTDELFVDELSGNAAVNGVPVTVSRAGG